MLFSKKAKPELRPDIAAAMASLPHANRRNLENLPLYLDFGEEVHFATEWRLDLNWPHVLAFTQSRVVAFIMLAGSNHSLVSMPYETIEYVKFGDGRKSDGMRYIAHFCVLGAGHSGNGYYYVTNDDQPVLDLGYALRAKGIIIKNKVLET